MGVCFVQTPIFVHDKQCITLLFATRKGKEMKNRQTY